MSNDPCATCPWRRSSTPGGFDIPSFDIELMRNLRETVGRGDEFRPVMACHYSPCGEETPCVGYLAIEGYHNLAVRVMAITNKIDLPAIWEACDELDLWPSFFQMLDAYERALEEEPA
jgi:hypothetical protein